MRSLSASRIRWLSAAFACWSASVVAQPPSAAPNTLTLSEAERTDLLNNNSEASIDAARSGLGGGAPSRQIHGEIGATIGSNGSRGAYGVAAIPLGDNAGATVSFESSRYGGRRW